MIDIKEMKKIKVTKLINDDVVYAYYVEHEALEVGFYIHVEETLHRKPGDVYIDGHIFIGNIDYLIYLVSILDKIHKS